MDPLFLSQLKWSRSKKGLVNSKCGRYKIKPGKFKYKTYRAYYNKEVIRSWCVTHRGAKEVCQRHHEKQEVFIHLKKDDDYTYCGSFHDNNQDRGVSEIQVTTNPIEVTCIRCLSTTHPNLAELEKRRRMIAEIMKS